MTTPHLSLGSSPRLRAPSLMAGLALMSMMGAPTPVTRAMGLKPLKVAPPEKEKTQADLDAIEKAKLKRERKALARELRWARQRLVNQAVKT